MAQIGMSLMWAWHRGEITFPSRTPDLLLVAANCLSNSQPTARLASQPLAVTLASARRRLGHFWLCHLSPRLSSCVTQSCQPLSPAARVCAVVTITPGFWRCLFSPSLLTTISSSTSPRSRLPRRL